MEETINHTKEKSDRKLIQLLAEPAGITINGNQAWDIQIHNENTYSRVINEGALGLGESYMDGWWDCERLDIFFDKLLRAQVDTKIIIPFHYKMKGYLASVINLQTKMRSKQVAEQHYDLGNDLFSLMLDPYMNYSCGYWQDATSLEEAQVKKLDLICQKLELRPGLRLLDIGCGWGGLARYAAEKYGVDVVGVTISQQQYEYGKERCQGLPVTIRLQDYRDIREQFDRIVSVGMFEHVGAKNYKTFMQTAHRALTDDGLFLLHTIGSNDTYPLTNEWIFKYIFPNGVLPSIAQIGTSIEKLFVMEDWHSFGAYYDNTLMAWYENFARNWPQLKHKYNERFYRMWTYYLLCCAGSFRARVNQLWQVVLTKYGKVGGYAAPR